MLAGIWTYVRHHHLALLALFIALGGTAWAIEANSVKSKHIVNGQVKPKDLGVGGKFKAAGGLSANNQCVPLSSGWWWLGGFDRIGYYRDPTGMVHLRGIALSCDPSPYAIFHLPKGYRPVKGQVLPALASTGSVRLNIDPDGAVARDIPPPNNSWVSLDNISFRCGPSGQNGCP